MDVTTVGRNAEISSRLRDYIEDKAVKIEQFDPRAQCVEVKVTHEHGPHQIDTTERVETTVISKNPTIRAETSSLDRFTALDTAVGKLVERLHRTRDRKKDHHCHHTVVTPNEDLQTAPGMEALLVSDAGDAPTGGSPSTPIKPGVAVEAQFGDPPVIVRQKLHEAESMTVDKVPYQMGLVGYPFYLFIEKSSKQPCAVYHHHGQAYGVIRLDAQVL